MKKMLFCAAIAALSLVSCQPSGNNKVTTENNTVETETMEKVLVVVDVQRDFFDPTGSLYVGGSEVLPEKIAAIAGDYDAVIFTLDWHPANHCSFSEQGGIWPSHCVAYTQGAGLPDCFSAIIKNGNTKLFFKGNQQDKEQYGAFESFEGCEEIQAWLQNCSSVDVCGIAGDYCVKESTANILKIVPAEKVSVLMDCVRSIDGGEAIEAFVAENGLGRK